MKYFFMIFFTLILLSITGCDGDDDNSAVPPPAPGHVSGQEVTIKQGTATVPLNLCGINVATFSVKTTGTLKATVTWSGAPNDLDSYLYHYATATFEDILDATSPIVVTIDVTQDLVDADEEWRLRIRNDTGPDAEVSYIVTFTAD